MNVAPGLRRATVSQYVVGQNGPRHDDAAPPSDGDGWQESVDDVAEEAPLTILVNGDALATTLRTPGQDRELTLGFALAEGLIRGLDDVTSVYPCARPTDPEYGHVVNLQLAPTVTIDDERWEATRRRQSPSSACGACGHRDVATLLTHCPAAPMGVELAASSVIRAVRGLLDQQPLFAQSGGMHAASVVQRGGQLRRVFEDVGRHNAADKALGAWLLRPSQDQPGKALVVSSRVGFEIVQKAGASRIPIVIGVSAPTSLAIAAAQQLGMTLIAFARGERFNVYTGRERIIG